MFGALAGVFMGAGAVGQVVTGNIADRFGMRAAVVLPLLLSVPAGLACFLSPSLPVVFVACAAAGLSAAALHGTVTARVMQRIEERGP